MSLVLPFLCPALIDCPKAQVGYILSKKKQDNLSWEELCERSKYSHRSQLLSPFLHSLVIREFGFEFVPVSLDCEIEDQCESLSGLVLKISGLLANGASLISSSHIISSHAREPPS